MTVHSTQLGHANALGTGGTTLYTVPSGIRTILKSMVLTNLGASAMRPAIALMHGATTLATINLDLGASGTDTETLTWLPWIVLNAGDSIVVTPRAGTMDVIASGSELTL